MLHLDAEWLLWFDDYHRDFMRLCAEIGSRKPGDKAKGFG